MIEVRRGALASNRVLANGRELIHPVVALAVAERDAARHERRRGGAFACLAREPDHAQVSGHGARDTLGVWGCESSI